MDQPSTGNEKPQQAAQTSAADNDLQIEEIEEKLLASRRLNFEGKLNESEKLLSETIEQALKYYKDDLSFGMAAYYFEYGSLLLKKLESSTQIFGETVNNETKKDEQDSDQESEESEREEENNNNTEASATNTETQQNTSSKLEQLKQSEIKESKEEEKNECPEIMDEPNNDTNYYGNNNKNNDSKSKNEVGEDTADKNNNIDDLQIAFENLEASKQILQLELEKNDLPASTVVDLQQKKAQVYTRIGDLECWRDNMTQAIIEYEQGLELRKCTQGPESRDLSESYFLLGNALLYDNQEECETKAIYNYLNSAQILENILTTKLGINSVNILATFKNPEDLPRERLKFGFLDDEETKDMKSIISSLYDQIEDTWLQRAEQDKVKAQTQRMKEVIANSSNKFTTIGTTGQNGEPKKIINLGVVGSAAIKRKLPNTDSTATTTVSQGTTGEDLKISNKENQKENMTMISNNIIIKTSPNSKVDGGVQSEQKIQID